MMLDVVTRVSVVTALAGEEDGGVGGVCDAARLSAAGRALKP